MLQELHRCQHTHISSRARRRHASGVSSSRTSKSLAQRRARATHGVPAWGAKGKVGARVCAWVPDGNGQQATGNGQQVTYNVLRAFETQLERRHAIRFSASYLPRANSQEPYYNK